MQISITKSKVSGEMAAPSSKSYTIRGLMCAGMAGGISDLWNPLISDDTIAALNALEQIGVKIKRDASHWLVSGGSFRQPEGDIYCNESAATLRFLAAICSMIPGQFRLTAAPSLAKRPLKPLLEALAQVGGRHSAGPGSAITIHGGAVKSGDIDLPGDISSQYVSALLLAAPLAGRDIRIKLNTAPKSKPYIMMTIKCMETFGVRVDYSMDLSEYRVSSQEYKAGRYAIEGDWSSAAYLLALGAVAGEETVTNLSAGSLQADREILNILTRMGANVQGGPDRVTVKAAPLKAIKADLSDCIDLLPTVSVLAALAEGTSEFTGISAARLKESDRVHSVKQELKKTGINVKEKKDSLLIYGGYPKNVPIDAHNDHRIAMAFSIIGAARGITIDGAECVSKTFPGFWSELKSAGVELNKDE
jgi:3-phosphoshikimate 1-carboxyvinyltransferase